MQDELISAREIYRSLGYVDWRNFRGVVERARNLIQNGARVGSITESTRLVTIGKQAKRSIPDYLMDKQAFHLVTELAASHKLNWFFGTRNETAILAMLRKYCELKGLAFYFQYHLGKYRFDALVGDNLLIEFDEPHHKSSTRYIEIDEAKNAFAQANKYVLLRFDLNDDIVNVIVDVEAAIQDMNDRTRMISCYGTAEKTSEDTQQEPNNNA